MLSRQTRSLKKSVRSRPPRSTTGRELRGRPTMDSGPLQTIVHHLRRLANPAVGGPSPDAELLTRYARQRDQAAFAEIVQRHGPLVWTLCRSGLPAADADDAFQATFLVLARQVARIR